MITRRHRIGTIERLLNISCELYIKDYDNPGNTTFKVFRFQQETTEIITETKKIYKDMGTHREYDYTDCKVENIINPSQGKYIYDGIYTKDQLISECNR